MSVAYLASAGGHPSASQLNALTAELDDALRVLFADKSWLVYIGMAGIVPEGERFYFGTSASWKIIPIIAPGATAYVHATFTAAAAALTATSYDLPTTTAEATEADPWPLLGSLETHKTNHLGDDYYWRQDMTGSGDYNAREVYKRFAVAEIVIEAWGSGTFTWPATHDKYHFLRFHNLDNQTLTVDLDGTNTVSIPPFGVRAVRRTYPHVDAWDSTYVYLWKAKRGDYLLWDSEHANNVASLMCYHDWLDSCRRAMPAGTVNGRGRARTTRGLHIDPTEVWDGAALLPQAISGSEKLAKYEHHLGKILVVQDASGVTPTMATITPDWTTIAAGTGGIKFAASTGAVPHTLTISSDTGAVTPVDIFGVGSTVTPRFPKTLPATIRCDQVGIGVEVAVDDRRINGVDEATFSATVLGVSHSVTYYEFGQRTGGGDALFTSPATASHWSTLTDHATLASSAVTEQAATPTIAWKSDGWRLVACTAATYEPALEVWPVDASGYPETQLALIDQDDGFTISCGNDVLARDSWDITLRTYGRRMSAYVGTESGGVVTYSEHPDYLGFEPIRGGIEFRENRISPTDAATLRTESIGITAAGTFTLPVFPSPDSGEVLARNATDAAWYASHRTDLLAETIPVEDTEELVRLTILAAHYNHVAQRLNGIFCIDPFLFEDVVYYGELEDATWPFAVVAPDYHCCVANSGSRAASLSISVSTLTINSVSGKYVTKANVKTFAAAAGLRYYVEELSGLYDWDGASDESLSTSYYSENDNTLPYRYSQSLVGAVYGVVGVDDGTTRGPASIGPGIRYGDDPTLGAMLELEATSDVGTAPPATWVFDGASWLYTYAHSTVHYDNDPLVLADLLADLEPASLYSAPGIAPALWPLADLPQYIAPQDIADLYSGTAASRQCYKIAIIPRFVFLRA